MEDAVIHYDDFNSISPLLSRDTGARGIWAVYDGHGGSEVSNLAAEIVHKDFVYFLTKRKKCDEVYEEENSDEVLVCLEKAIKKSDKYICEKAIREGIYMHYHY